jgi:hypothetical protein
MGRNRTFTVRSFSRPDVRVAVLQYSGENPGNLKSEAAT